MVRTTRRVNDRPVSRRPDRVHALEELPSPSCRAGGRGRRRRLRSWQSGIPIPVSVARCRALAAGRRSEGPSAPWADAPSDDAVVGQHVAAPGGPAPPFARGFFTTLIFIRPGIVQAPTAARALHPNDPGDGDSRSAPTRGQLTGRVSDVRSSDPPRLQAEPFGRERGLRAQVAHVSAVHPARQAAAGHVSHRRARAGDAALHEPHDRHHVGAGRPASGGVGANASADATGGMERFHYRQTPLWK